MRKRRQKFKFPSLDNLFQEDLNFEKYVSALASYKNIEARCGKFIGKGSKSKP